METHDFSGSTRVTRGSYDPEDLTITVVFPDGNRWRYRGCSEQVWREFVRAASPGRYLNEVLTGHAGGPA